MSKLRFGMVGGGPGAFIGDIHCRAARFDGLGELTGGCFSRDYDKSLRYGREQGLCEDRIYSTYREMADKEACREDGIDFVIIAAPNDVHYDCCRVFLEHGIHVVCDKPLTIDSRQARKLKSLAEEQDLLFAVTYPYAAMPAASFMRQMIEEGRIGDMILIRGEYLSDNLLRPNRDLDPGLRWRIDPAKAGPSTCCADIGVHLQHLISFVTGLKIRELSADMNVIGEDRRLDTNVTATVRYENHVKGHLWCSNVAAGKYNDLNISVFGTRGSLSWSLEDPDMVTFGGEPGRTVQYRMGRTQAGDRDPEIYRLPAGQSEGYYLAFANIYRAFMTDLRRKKAGQPLRGGYPGIDDGIESLDFVEACIASSRRDGRWVGFDRKPIPGADRLKVVRATDMPQRAGACYVRIQGMAVKHHISMEEEFDEHDAADAKHILLLDDVLPVATCRIFGGEDGTVIFGRLVVLPEYRHQGVGSRIVAEAEAWSRELGFRRVRMDARENKVGFYERLGYTKAGPPLQSGPFRCIPMTKELWDRERSSGR